MSDFSTESWEELVALALAEVNRTVAALPAELRVLVEKLPVTCQPFPSDDLVADGIERDTLGLFVGEPYAMSVQGAGPFPTEVFLYLDNLWELAEGDTEEFEAQVRTTLLHELGHYLGLDEEDLEARGLE